MSMTRFMAAAPLPQRRFGALLVSSICLAVAIGACPTAAQAQFSGNTSNDVTSPSSTDVSRVNNPAPAATDSPDAVQRLRQPAPATYGPRDGQPEPRLVLPAEPYKPGEFEQYVQQLVVAQGSGTPQDVRRFGANLVTDDAIASATQDPLPSVPGDYIIRPGDEIALTIWGTVDADLRLTVDRAGRISVPRVGTISVAGLRNADLADAISRRTAQTFKNFQLTATLGQVRAIRVFVSGYVQRPGSVTVNGLSSVLHALMRAGGPSVAGSFRDIHLRRAGHEVAVFDLYDLLLKGDRNTDQLVQPDDIIFVGPVGTQVAVLGSVNQQAIYELKPGQTLDDVLAMAGGFSAVADRTRVAVERLADRTNGHVAQFALPAQGGTVLGTGDVIRAFSTVTSTLSLGSQNERIHVDGEVMHPGDYILPPGSRVADALRAAGGMTAAAYPYGTELTRDSVRQTQQANYDRALRDLETDMSRTQASQRATSAEELNAQSASATANNRLLERLRQVRPTGRVVLQMPPDATSLPDLPLENGDSISIPPRGSSVGVFGSVFNTGSFVFEPGHTTTQYLALAGGPTRGADKNSIFMIRANGSVVSAQQGASFWRSGNSLAETVVEPGDTLFVPEQLNKSTFVQDAKDWTQILYQFGLGLAGIKTLGL
ncbi:SLBB domain-containing protein [Scleromatobacter humisilvae]|uniref:SLBB domain-containing protein n=1 Tax=Scleromatobacter humisilvae TaxID=2897159 RepID=A0A9X1YKP9_9BURK|nr:SLBB domain-containing protein [Scleromatobacter humisilvae]MCK9688344.1 SLBB domain-containing protein [Scleromatobacter humisilvae]